MLSSLTAETPTCLGESFTPFLCTGICLPSAAGGAAQQACSQGRDAGQQHSAAETKDTTKCDPTRWPFCKNQAFWSARETCCLQPSHGTRSRCSSVGGSRTCGDQARSRHGHHLCEERSKWGGANTICRIQEVESWNSSFGKVEKVSRTCWGCCKRIFCWTSIAAILREKLDIVLSNKYEYVNVSIQSSIFTHATKMLISTRWKFFLAFDRLIMTKTARIL